MSRFEKTSTNQTGTTQQMKRHQDRNAVSRCPTARSSNPHPSSVQVSGRRVTKIHPCCPNMVIAPSLIREAELFNTPLQRSLGRSTPELRVLGERPPELAPCTATRKSKEPSDEGPRSDKLLLLLLLLLRGTRNPS